MFFFYGVAPNHNQQHVTLKQELVITLKVWALRLTGLYSNICNNMSIMFRICNDRAMEAIRKDATDGSLEVGKFSLSLYQWQGHIEVIKGMPRAAQWRQRIMISLSNIAISCSSCSSSSMAVPWRLSIWTQKKASKGGEKHFFSSVSL